MQQQANNHRRQTPGRRRQNRNATQSPAGAAPKSDLSENDVQSDAPFHNGNRSADRPRTPRKASSTSPAPSSSLHPSSSQQSKSRAGKPRPKNVSTSPGPMKPGRKTPPQSGGLPKSSSTAYAGATFHASPAPSSLPMPSFFAKAMPDSPGLKNSGRLVSQELSPPPTDSEKPTPHQRLSAASKPSREESPLDIFFNADRAEKEKARRASSANVLGPVSGTFSPPSLPRSPQQNVAAAARESPLQQCRRPHLHRNSTVGISATELNNNPGQGMGPAFSTPYSDRIKAARSNEKQVRGPPQDLPQQPQQQRQQHFLADRSEALKNFLFAGQKLNPSPNTTEAPRMSVVPPCPATGFISGSGRAQVQQIYATSPPHSVADGRSADLRAMEDNLRRMLKLDSPISLGPKPSLASSHPAKPHLSAS